MRMRDFRFNKIRQANAIEFCKAGVNTKIKRLWLTFKISRSICFS